MNYINQHLCILYLLIIINIILGKKCIIKLQITNATQFRNSVISGQPCIKKSNLKNTGFVQITLNKFYRFWLSRFNDILSYIIWVLIYIIRVYCMLLSAMWTCNFTILILVLIARLLNYKKKRCRNCHISYVW